MGRVEALCISRKKGTCKKEVAHALFIEDWGIKGDAHGGTWHRQVSLLEGEKIDKVKYILPGIVHGSFAENLITRDIPLSLLDVGERVGIGDTVVLEITQRGKECHADGCAIKRSTGECIMPREGLFARVLKGGDVKRGDPIRRLSIHH